MRDSIDIGFSRELSLSYQARSPSTVKSDENGLRVPSIDTMMAQRAHMMGFVSRRIETGTAFKGTRTINMFFLASKTVGVLLIPSNLIIVVGFVGLTLFCTDYRSVGRKLVVACVASFVICGFSPFGNILLVPLETRFPSRNAGNGEPNGIVVLGGVIDPDLSAARGVPVFGSGADRIVAAASLARLYPKARIVYSGGNPNVSQGDDANEADYAASVFQSLGISRNRLLLERLSRNTEENAEFSKALATPKSDERWLLLTSAYHMPRAVGAFRKVGFAVEPYPVDWKTRGPSDIFTIPDRFLARVQITDIAVREWIGLVAYRMAGKTNEFFPSPLTNH